MSNGKTSSQKKRVKKLRSSFVWRVKLHSWNSTVKMNSLTDGNPFSVPSHTPGETLMTSTDLARLKWKIIDGTQNDCHTRFSTKPYMVYRSFRNIRRLYAIYVHFTFYWAFPLHSSYGGFQPPPLHLLKSLCSLPSFLFHPLLRYFRQFPPTSRKSLLP